MICVCAEQSWNLGYNKEIWLRGKITGFFDEETGNGLIFLPVGGIFISPFIPSSPMVAMMPMVR